MTTTRWSWKTALVVVGFAASTGAAQAQTVAERVGAAPDGKIRMTYAARPGVCGNGPNINTGRGDNADWEWECEPGPVRVVLTKSGGEVTRVHTYVGGGWRAASRVADLGTVSASEAADYLTGLVRSGGDRASRDAVMPASIADSAVVWPALIDVARDANRPRRTRRVALQWVGMAAGDVVTDGQMVVDDADRETREQAVFAVSQLPKDEGVPLLIEVARSHRDPQVRRRALFWLGQSGDARAIDLFEELLRGR